MSLDKVKNKIKILNVILSEISKWIENFLFILIFGYYYYYYFLDERQQLY